MRDLSDAMLERELVRLRALSVEATENVRLIEEEQRIRARVENIREKAMRTYEIDCSAELVRSEMEKTPLSSNGRIAARVVEIMGG